MAIGLAASNMSQLAKSIYGLESQSKADSTDAIKSDGPSSFANIFKDQINQVNALHLESDDLTQQMAAGNVDNIEEVLIKAEEARIALDLTVQITSKITQAYQEIMRMQV